MDILIRGFIALNSGNALILNHNKLNGLIDDLQLKLEPGTKLALKLELLHTLKSFEHLYISDILNLLEQENSVDLEQQFNRYIIARLTHKGINSFSFETKAQLQRYLGASQSNPNKIKIMKYNTGKVGLLGHGMWLEATALVNSDSLGNAVKYIAAFISDKHQIEEQERYVIGLSNTAYMKKAFSSEPVLKAFKEQRRDVYLNTVGIPNH